MARTTKTLVISPWIGGLNTSEDPSILGQDPSGQQELTQFDNYVFGSNSHSRKKRGGQARYNSASVMTSGTAATPVDCIYVTDYWANISSTKTQRMVAITEGSPGKIWRSSYTGSMTAMVFSGVTPVFTQGNITSQVMNEDLIIGYSKSAPPIYWDNQNPATNIKPLTASTGTTPNGRLVRQHLNRLWIAGTGAFPDRIYYSGADNHLSWDTASAAGFIDIYPGDGDPEGITAIFPSLNTRELYVAKRTSLYKIDTSSLSDSDWAVVPVSGAIGCVAHNTAIPVNQSDLIFCSDQGVHTLGQVISQTQVIPEEFLSASIQPDYNDIITASQRFAMSAVWDQKNGNYLLCTQRVGMTVFETVYVYNVSFKKWLRWTSVPCNHIMKRLKASTGDYEIYTADQSGKINIINQSAKNDFGAAISSVFKTVVLYPQGNFLFESNFTNFRLLCKSVDTSSLRIDWMVDASDKQTAVINQRINSGNTLGTTLLGAAFILGSPTTRKPISCHLNGYGHGIEITVTHDTLNKTVEILGMGIEFEPGEESEDGYRNIS